MYGNPKIPGAGPIVAAGGGALAWTGAPPVVWLLALASALIVTGALSYRSRRLVPVATPPEFMAAA